MPPRRDIPLEVVSTNFRHPIDHAAFLLQTCSSVLKRICRGHGIRRWPYQQLRFLDQRLFQLKTVGSLQSDMLDDEACRLFSQRRTLLKGLRSEPTFGEWSRDEIEYFLQLESAVPAEPTENFQVVSAAAGKRSRQTSAVTSPDASDGSSYVESSSKRTQVRPGRHATSSGDVTPRSAKGESLDRDTSLDVSGAVAALRHIAASAKSGRMTSTTHPSTLDSSNPVSTLASAPSSGQLSPSSHIRMVERSQAFKMPHPRRPGTEMPQLVPTGGAVYSAEMTLSPALMASMRQQQSFSPAAGMSHQHRASGPLFIGQPQGASGSQSPLYSCVPSKPTLTASPFAIASACSSATARSPSSFGFTAGLGMLAVPAGPGSALPLAPLPSTVQQRFAVLSALPAAQFAQSSRVLPILNEVDFRYLRMRFNGFQERVEASPVPAAATRM